MADQATQPIVNDVSPPAITRHPAPPTGSTEEAESAVPVASVTAVSTTGTTITPIVIPAEDNVSEETVSTEPSTQSDDAGSVEESPAQTTTPPPATPPASPYEASDALPDMSQQLTTKLTNDMQTPRIYDTKEYIVPIKDTMHSHGTIGILVAGLVSAAVVVGIVFAIAYYLI